MSVEHFLNMLKTDIPLAYDIESNGLRWQGGFVCGYSISDGKDAYYVPVRHGGGGNIDNPEAFEEVVADTIKNRTSCLITHNGKFDSHFSLNHGIELGDKIRDTMIAAALLDENQFSYSLKNVAGKYPDIPQKQDSVLYAHLAEQFGIPAKPAAMGSYWKLAGNDPIGVEYACHDTLATWHVSEKQKKQLYAENLDYIYALENSLLHVLRKMERHGIKVDLEEISRVQAKIEEMQLEAYDKLPLREDLTPFNVRSNRDLQEYFELHNFTDWEFTKPTQRHPEGQPSFNKTFLGHSEPGKILLEARAIDHFKNSFVDPIHDYIYEGVIYTNFNQTYQETGSGTKSGRLSCTNPNMQQIPKRAEELGRIFRRIFVAREGYTFVEFDYSQAEPRLFSHYSDEPILIDGYNSNPPIDMHDIAAKYMGISRKVAKNLNLGLQYTMGVAKLAKQLGVDDITARAMYAQWKSTFPNVSTFTKRATQVAEHRGYVRTILGRRARFPDPRWAYRAANRIVQGGSADILKYVMVKLDGWIERERLADEIHLLLNIHDAILFEVRDDKLDQHIASIKEIMENLNSPPFNLKVPFVADWKSGKNWCDATY